MDLNVHSFRLATQGRTRFIAQLLSQCLAHLPVFDDDPDTRSPFHPLYFPCSSIHTLCPKNVGPNTSASTQETLAGASLNSSPLASLPYSSHFVKDDIQYACGHDPWKPHPSISEYPPHHKPESEGNGNGPGYPLSEHGTDISCSILYEPSNWKQCAHLIFALS